MSAKYLTDSPLRQAVERFARLAWPLSEASLERPWSWGDYDEGVRFAFFRTYEELRELAVELKAARERSPAPMTSAQRILAQYHAAYLDLLAVLVSANDSLAEQEPEDGGWPLRNVLVHIIEAEQGFYFITRYALERERGSEKPPADLSEESWSSFWQDDLFTAQQETSPMSALLAYYAGLEERILQDFTGVSDAELGVASPYWESVPMSIQFRLHRFDSHLRQHTVQAEKILAMLNPANEARLLLRLIYAALGEVEGTLIGDWDAGSDRCRELAFTIGERTREIAQVVAGYTYTEQE